MADEETRTLPRGIIGEARIELQESDIILTVERSGLVISVDGARKGFGVSNTEEIYQALRTRAIHLDPNTSPTATERPRTPMNETRRIEEEFTEKVKNLVQEIDEERTLADERADYLLKKSKKLNRRLKRLEKVVGLC